MESVLLFVALVVSLWVFAIGIAGPSDKWESEDQAQYECFNPRVKTVREVYRKEPTPPQTKDSAVTVDKKPEKASAFGHDLRETTSVHSVMVKKAHYCFESQSVDEARRIMSEHDLPYLLVLDKDMRIVGTVRMRDLMVSDEDRPHSGG